MTNITKIITHAGAWHADEISALAIFSIVLNKKLKIERNVALDPDGTTTIGAKGNTYLGDILLERKYNISEEEIADPTVMILDIGKKYDLSLSNLDHHQNGQLEASNIMMLNWLQNLNGKKDKILLKLQEMLFNRVSDIDRGIIPNGGEAYEFNSIIKSCYNFEEALDLGIMIISRMIFNIMRAIKDEELFNKLPTTGVVAINKDSNIILGWKEFAEAKGINFLVTPNARGGFNLISRDSVAFPIAATANQTFRHESGFMAVYASQKEAIEAGQIYHL